MLDKELDKLEAKIAVIEEYVEDSDFVFDDEFLKLYNELIGYYTEIKETEIDSFPHRELSEIREGIFQIQLKRFKKLELRIKRTKEDADIDGALDSDWMFDKDENEID